MARLGSTDLDVFPLCLGGNVFGWTIDEERSFAVLDAYFQAGGNFIDTSDSYGRRGPGGPGESERIIGRWIASRGNRDSLVIATKVGVAPDLQGLSGETIRRGIEGSLQRLGVDMVDLYYAHRDDPDTPLSETLGEFGALIAEGKRGGEDVDSPRAASVRESYFNERGFAVLDALDEIAAAHGSSQAAVALAWLLAQQTVLAPIASATSTAQLSELLECAELELSAAELERLGAASSGG